MTLVLALAASPAVPVAQAVKSWCSGCPHHGRSGDKLVCDADPYNSKPLRPALDQNESLRVSTDAQRKLKHDEEVAAGRLSGDYVPRPRASAATVERWRLQGLGRGAARRAPAAQVSSAAAAHEHDEFFTNIIDFSDETFGKVTAGMAHTGIALDDYDSEGTDECDPECGLECECAGCCGTTVATVAAADTPFFLRTPGGSSVESSAAGPSDAFDWAPTPLPPISADAAPELQAMLASGGSNSVRIPVVPSPVPMAPLAISGNAATATSLPPPMVSARFSIEQGGLASPPPSAQPTSAPTETTVMASPPTSAQPAPAPAEATAGGEPELTRTTGELAMTAGRLAAEQSVSPSYVAAVVVAVLAGVMCAFAAHRQANLDMLFAMASGAAVTAVLVSICNLNTADTTALCRIMIALITSMLRALIFAIRHAHILAAIFAIVCVCVRGASGLTSPPEHGDGGALYKSTGSGFPSSTPSAPLEPMPHDANGANSPLHDATGANKPMPHDAHGAGSLLPDATEVNIPMSRDATEASSSPLPDAFETGKPHDAPDATAARHDAPEVLSSTPHDAPDAPSPLCPRHDATEVHSSMSPDALDAMSPPCPRPKATETHGSTSPNTITAPPPDATRAEAVRAPTYDATLVDTTTASSEPLAQSNVEGANF